jgi:hypothetical protein
MVFQLTFNEENMRKIFMISTLLIILMVISTCTDIDKFSDNSVKVPIVNILTKDDSLTYLETSPINLDTIVKPRIRYYQITLTNLSDKYELNIYSLVFEKDSSVEIQVPNGYPIILKPKQANNDSPVILRLNSSLAKKGDFYGKIMINESEKHFIEVKAYIK